MASPHVNDIVAIDNTGNTTVTFDNYINSLIIWSADDSFHIEFDATAAVVGSFLHPKDSVISYAIGCKSIGLRAQNGAAVVNYIATYHIEGVHDTNVQENRGGVHFV